MSSQWVNKYAIMRDLSLAQGCVPVDVAGTVEAGDKPPSQNLIEETEEELYRSWVGSDGDFSAPDLGLIKHMLNIVRNHEVPSDCEDDSEKVIEISRLNPLSPEFCPQNLGAGDGIIANKKTKPVKEKKKKERNAAIESLLQNIDKDNSTKEVKESEKLTKPEDFISMKRTVVSEVNKKVFDWFREQERDATTPNHSKKTTIQLDFNPSMMFKKKASPNSSAKLPVNPTKEVKTTSPHVYGKFVPSDNAAEYYKEFVECSKMKKIVQDDVWTKVEKQMKQIDERRQAEAELMSLSLALCWDNEEASAITATDPVQQKLDIVRLPRHRHAMGGPCAVCNAFTKHGRKIYDIGQKIDDSHQNDDDYFQIIEESSQNDDSLHQSVDDSRQNDDNACQNDDNACQNDDNACQNVDNTSPVEQHIKSWSSPEPKNSEELDCWRSDPMDDEDEIQSWRTETLGDDCIENDIPDETKLSSWLNEEDEIENYTEADNRLSWRALLFNKTEETETNNNNRKTEKKSDNEISLTSHLDECRKSEINTLKHKKLDKAGKVVEASNSQDKVDKGKDRKSTTPFQFEITKTNMPYTFRSEVENTNPNGCKLNDNESYQFQITKATENGVSDIKTDKKYIKQAVKDAKESEVLFYDDGGYDNDDDDKEFIYWRQPLETLDSLSDYSDCLS